MRALVCFTLFFVLSPGYVRADESKAGHAPSDAVVTLGNARFTALTPRLIRMEWSPDGKFEDRPSLAFIDRTPTATFTQSADPAGTTVLKTSEISIRYKDDGNPFSADNLSITQVFKFNKKPNVWTPGASDKGNLLGTFRTLDGVNGATQLEKGILSRDGWAIVDDSGKPVLDKKDGRQWFAERKVSSTLDWYYFGYGHDYKEALADFTKFAGKIPLPPRFVFGAWWSRYWAYSDAELRELVKEFKENDVPLDVLVIDMDWHLDGWTGYTWNPKYFPDPEGFLKWAHHEGLKITLNLHPADGVGKHENAFPDVCKAMGLDPEKTEKIPFDCTDPKFVDAYFKFLHHPLEKMGIDFWWMDWQQGGETKIKNLDPLMALNHLHWQDMADRAGETGKRPLIFSRWGGLGNHRYQIGFSGDTFCNWPSLAFQPYFTATAGNVGYAYWSHDIGGHQPGPVDPELYVRWIQWGALSPILRTHTTKNPLAERRIWKFPKEYFEAARKAYQFRYELIPYIYTMARKCHDTGIPLCRPLYYEWPEMEDAYTWKNEYMFGDDLLAAPVTEAADPISGCAMVEVWIPPGKWVNWFTGRQYEGPTTARLVVPLDEIPLFARAGAIIPTSPNPYHSDLDLSTSMELNVFPRGTSEIAQYLDDGCTNKYLNGAFSKLPAKTVADQDSLDLTIGPVVGEQPGRILASPFRIRFLGSEEFIQTTENLEQILERGHDRQYFASYLDLRELLSAKSSHFSVAVDSSKPLLLTVKGADKKMTEAGHAIGLNNNVGVQLIGGDPKWKMGYFVGPMTILSSDLSIEEKRKWVVRLLGLFSKYWIETDATKNPAKTTAHFEFEITDPVYKKEGKLGEWNGRLISDSALLQLGESGLPVELDPYKLFRLDINIPPITQTEVIECELELQGEGHTITIPMSMTFLPSIGSWQILGPFDVPFTKSFDTKFPPDDKIDLAAEYPGKDNRKIKWQLVERKITPDSNLTDEFFIDFDDVFNGRVYECVAYALTYLDAPEEMDAVLAFGTDDGCIVRLNGEEVFRVNVGRPYTSKQNRVPVRLKKGENELLLKINQGGGDWGFCVHLESPDGKPLTQVKTRTTPKGK